MANEKMSQFSANDVHAIARAIGSGLYIDEEGMNAHLRCSYCQESIYFSWQKDESEQRKAFKHSLRCPVLIAQDLLTGAE